MHEARAGWPRSQAVAQVPVSRDRQALLFLHAIHFRGDDLPVPMHELRRIGVVEQIHGDRDAFAQAD